MATDPQLLKGTLPILLLAALESEENYGYAIVTSLQASGFPDLSEGTVYPALSRMEQLGWLDSKLRASTSGPARKYYRITGAGRDQLAQAELGWRAFTHTVDTALSRLRERPAPAAPSPRSPRETS